MNDNSITFSTSSPILQINNLKSIGEGSYGMVLECEKQDGEKYAVKINITDIDTLGIGSLKEADVMNKLSNHPYVVRFDGILFGVPEIKNTTKSKLLNDAKKKKESRLDTVHFIMGLEETNLDYIIRRKKQISYKDIKIIIAQMLLGLEWIHSRSIMHLDIKPSNILYSNIDGNVQTRICDFGLSCFMESTKMNTNGVITSWYRPPEICLKKEVNQKADIWSTAVVAFELISKRALLYGVEDDNDSILEGIFKRFPKIASIDTINKNSDGYLKTKLNKFDQLTQEAKDGIMNKKLTDDERRKSTIQQLRTGLKLSAKDVENFISETDGKGTVSEFCDLLSRMLEFDPDKRLSASEALAHPFFEWMNEYINNVKEKFPLLIDSLPKIKIIPCMERKLATFLIIHLFNSSIDNKIDWYNNRVVFSALNLFDRYIAYMVENGKIKNNVISFNSNTMLIHQTEEDVYLRVYTCLYTFNKYFKILEAVESWDDFIPKKFNSSECKKIAIDFEMFLFKDVCKYDLYQDTLYEYISFRDDKRMSKNKARECIVALDNINEIWDNGSVRNLARHLNL